MADDFLLSTLNRTPPPAATTDDFAGKPTAEEQRALDVMYPRVPEPLAAGEFYSTVGMLRTKLNQNFLKLSDAGVLNLQQQETERKNYAALVRETGLPLAAAELLHDEWTSARLAQARAGGDNARDLAAQIVADNEASRIALRQQWGEKDAADLIERADKWVKAHPELHAITRTRGIGSRPAIVQAIIEHVRAIGYR